jgi:hypothetical protein
MLHGMQQAYAKQGHSRCWHVAFGWQHCSLL